MMIRPLSRELQIKSENELNEVPNRIEEDIEHIQEWLKKQPHLHVRTDAQWLISFLRGCKFSLQRTKEKIDYFYTMRTLVPEYFNNRDPFAPEIQTILQSGALVPLPQAKGIVGPRIIMLSWERCDPEIIPIINLMKVYFMLMDILMNEDDNCVISGIIFLAEYKGFNFNYLLQYTPSFLKKSVMCFQNAYPVRIKGIHCTNAPSVFEAIFNLAKTFMNNKMKERMSLYSDSNSEKVFKHFPKKALPKEFGGANGSVDVIAAYWKKKVESYREWFMEDANYCTIEGLRNGSPKTVDNVFGVEGTFRKLAID